MSVIVQSVKRVCLACSIKIPIKVNVVHTISSLSVERRATCVDINTTSVCVYHLQILAGCFKRKLHTKLNTIQFSVLYTLLTGSELSSIKCGTKIGSRLTIGCAKNEEYWRGRCYKKCSILTGGTHPLRKEVNTCARNGCGRNQDRDAGLCYPKCKKHYISVGPVCWGDCKHFCGKTYTNLGFYCWQWIPAKRCRRPFYGRGVGTLPHAPTTRGGVDGKGFGVANDGGVPRRNIEDLFPYEFRCNI